jgi:3-methyladenine DNA glycosylase/8-oxoguanine DNA glycosylase
MPHPCALSPEATNYGPSVRLAIDVPLDLGGTVGVHHHGAGDPTTIVTPGEAWLARRTPEGPATLRLSAGDGYVDAQAWGPGREWFLAGVPDLLGLHDDRDAVVAVHPAVADALRRLPGARLSRSRLVLPALVAAVLAHRVTSIEARRAWIGVCRSLGEPAPGPVRLLLPPDPDRLAQTPYWWFHRFGVDRRRASTIRRAVARADRVEECVSLPLAAAHRRLLALPGIGPWTVGTVAGPALGDPDAVVVGDYDFPHLVTWVLAGERIGTDDRMLELLAPYAGQRGRVQRLLTMAFAGPPRRAHRQRIQPVAAW